MSLDQPFMEHTDPLFVHGRGYDGPLKAPVVTWHSSLPPRDDHEAPPWLTATEFKGEQEVAVIKMRQLAKPMRLSRKTVVYSGTGISAAVISQAAKPRLVAFIWTASRTQ